VERAECVVVFGATELFAELRRVDDWPDFVEGLNAIEQLGHHRYRWDLVYAGSPRLVDVVLSFDHRRRSISWKSRHRPRFDGGLRLAPLDAHRTRIHLWMSVEPVGLVQSLTEPGLTNAMVARNLQRLSDWTATRRHAPAERVDVDF